MGALTCASVLLGAVDALPQWPGLVHAVAIPPLDLAFDLRVLVARASSYPLFALGAFVSLSVRSVILAAVLGGYGPESPFSARLRRAASFYLVAWVPAAVAAGLSFAALAAHYHWYFWAGLGVLLLISVALTRGAYPLRLRFRRLIAYLFLLTFIGGLAKGTGRWGSVALVPVSAALTLAVLRDSPRHRGQRPTSEVLFLSLACVMAAGMLAPLGVLSDGRVRTNGRTDAVLFLVPGVDTTSGHGSLYGFDPTALGFSCDRVFYYSYLGPGPGAPRGDARCPIRLHEPYGREDTQRGIEHVSDALARQVAEIGRTVDQPSIVVVTHSQGNLIAWRAISHEPIATVSRVVMLAGFAQNPAPYPAPDADGLGRVGGDILRLLSALARHMGVATFDPDAQLARQILATPGGTKGILSERLPSGVRALTVDATFDAPLFSDGRSVPGARDGGTVDTTHVGVVTSARTLEVIRRFLAGQPAGQATPLAVVLGWITPAFGSPPYNA